jgi:hypothetical protein
MPFETPIPIRQDVQNVLDGKYVLPAIQREFIWEPEQIELLFDSLLRGYPIRQLSLLGSASPSILFPKQIAQGNSPTVLRHAQNAGGEPGERPSLRPSSTSNRIHDLCLGRNGPTISCH